MIDTDKYEGHSEGEWKVGARKSAMTVRDSNGEEIAATNSYSNARIMADAPLLLAEVKRLQKEHDTVRGWFLDIDNYMMEHHYDMWQEIRKEIGLDD